MPPSPLPTWRWRKIRSGPFVLMTNISFYIFVILKTVPSLFFVKLYMCFFHSQSNLWFGINPWRINFLRELCSSFCVFSPIKPTFQRSLSHTPPLPHSRFNALPVRPIGWSKFYLIVHSPFVLSCYLIRRGLENRYSLLVMCVSRFRPHLHKVISFPYISL